VRECDGVCACSRQSIQWTVKNLATASDVSRSNHTFQKLKVSDVPPDCETYGENFVQFRRGGQLCGICDRQKKNVQVRKVDEGRVAMSIDDLRSEDEGDRTRRRSKCYHER